MKQHLNYKFYIKLEWNQTWITALYMCSIKSAHSQELKWNNIPRLENLVKKTISGKILAILNTIKNFCDYSLRSLYGNKIFRLLVVVPLASADKNIQNEYLNFENAKLSSMSMSGSLNIKGNQRNQET